jgi:hypothetical protein
MVHIKEVIINYSLFDLASEEASHCLIKELAVFVL